MLEETPQHADQVASLTLSRATTVFEAVTAFVEKANDSTSGATIEWKYIGDMFWILRRPSVRGPADSRVSQVDTY
jgi:hypothetical protein